MEKERTPMSIELIEMLRDEGVGIDFLINLGYHFYVFTNAFKEELIGDYEKENDPEINFESFAYMRFIRSLQNYIEKHTVKVNGELIIDEKEIEIT